MEKPVLPRAPQSTGEQLAEDRGDELRPDHSVFCHLHDR